METNHHIYLKLQEIDTFSGHKNIENCRQRLAFVLERNNPQLFQIKCISPKTFILIYLEI